MDTRHPTSSRVQSSPVPSSLCHPCTCACRTTVTSYIPITSHSIPKVTYVERCTTPTAANPEQKRAQTPEPRPQKENASNAALPCLHTTPPSKSLSHQKSNAVRPQKANRYKNHSTTTTALIIPASFSTATLFPLAAIRVNLDADPLRDEEKEENVSVCRGGKTRQQKNPKKVFGRRCNNIICGLLLTQRRTAKARFRDGGPRTVESITPWSRALS